jgi:hypothetical protein
MNVIHTNQNRQAHSSSWESFWSNSKFCSSAEVEKHQLKTLKISGSVVSKYYDTKMSKAESDAKAVGDDDDEPDDW